MDDAATTAEVRAEAPAVDAAPPVSGVASSTGASFATPVAREALRERRWYGWQTLAVDGGSIALAAAALGLSGLGSQRAPALVPLGGVVWLGAGLTYGIGPAVVHLTHHRPLAALGSALGRVVGVPLAVAGTMLGAALLFPPKERSAEMTFPPGTGEAAVVAGGSVFFTMIAVDAIFARDP
ncbi:MAG: hypothetical protein JNL38_24445 [Myxococcales bacterium]|nr:hypothetical protein [Myxococcales bacterium]